MTDRPILFSGEMVRALLDGRKTQTRRPLKPQPLIGFDFASYIPIGRNSKDAYFAHPQALDKGEYIKLPYQPGDRLWVRETHKQLHRKPLHPDFPHLPDVMYQDGEDYDICTKALGWKTVPSIHMPRWASRITLLVDDVKVQRLQEISEDDARAEGVEAVALTTASGVHPMPFKPRFRSLWNTLYPEQSWDANPWVVALTFRVIKQNIDHERNAA
jgi:hypothetical protein